MIGLPAGSREQFERAAAASSIRSHDQVIGAKLRLSFVIQRTNAIGACSPSRMPRIAYALIALHDFGPAVRGLARRERTSRNDHRQSDVSARRDSDFFGHSERRATPDVTSSLDTGFPDPSLDP
jgi:hypothetical protein